MEEESHREDNTSRFYLFLVLLTDKEMLYARLIAHTCGGLATLSDSCQWSQTGCLQITFKSKKKGWERREKAPHPHPEILRPAERQPSGVYGSA
ncbi:hypothetical protein CHARACLAT_002406 [Characodon lateralis]|uniref:Uncharacterized protein n=1 Tax=Characodon lateralis TaxID=208331 RepID=A0ABU7D3Z6_9TELE|nr:hypothetical protein [Characodon lateralis]